MDPITQGLLGAAASQAVFARRLPRSGWLIGLVAGMAADLDILIKPASDVLGGMSYHRHFTHSLAFIPVGAFIAALPFFLMPAFKPVRKQVYGAALVAYATHGLLDTCTTYGTVLLWPFTEARYAWDIIGIIDPAFTIALLAGVIVSRARRNPRFARMWLTVALMYLGLGIYQHHQAASIQQRLADERGHAIERGRVMPSPGNTVLWRSVYLADGRLHSDSIRVGVPFIPAGEPTIQIGRSRKHVTRDTLKASGITDEQALDAFDRFAWFSDGYTAWDEAEPGVIGDMRYIGRPDRFASMWGLRMPQPGDDNEATPRWARMRKARSEAMDELLEALFHEHPGFMTFEELLADPRDGHRTRVGQAE